MTAADAPIAEGLLLVSEGAVDACRIPLQHKSGSDGLRFFRCPHPSRQLSLKVWLSSPNMASKLAEVGRMLPQYL